MIEVVMFGLGYIVKFGALGMGAWEYFVCKNEVKGLLWLILGSTV